MKNNKRSESMLKLYPFFTIMIFLTTASVDSTEADEIVQSGALQLGELVADATYNYGSVDVRNALNGGGDGYTTNFNLRGLGSRATPPTLEE